MTGETRASQPASQRASHHHTRSSSRSHHVVGLQSCRTAPAPHHPLVARSVCVPHPLPKHPHHSLVFPATSAASAVPSGPLVSVGVFCVRLHVFSAENRCPRLPRNAPSLRFMMRDAVRNTQQQLPCRLDVDTHRILDARACPHAIVEPCYMHGAYTAKSNPPAVTPHIYMLHVAEPRAIFNKIHWQRALQPVTLALGPAHRCVAFCQAVLLRRRLRARGRGGGVKSERTPDHGIIL